MTAQAFQAHVKMIAIPPIAVMPSKAHGVRTVPVPATTVTAAMAATPGERRGGRDPQASCDCCRERDFP